MTEPEQVDVEDLEKSNKVYQFKKSVMVDYSKWLYNNDYAPLTSKEYCRHLKKLLGEENNISIDKIKDYLNNKKNKNTISYASIRLFIKFLDDKFGVNFPYFIYPRFRSESKLKEPAPTKEEVKLIIKEFEKDMDLQQRVYDYTLFIEFLFRMGNRISEVVKLRVANFDWKIWLEYKNEWGKVAFIKTKGKKSRLGYVPIDLMNKVYLYIIKDEGKIYDKNAFVFDFNFERYKMRKFRKFKKAGKSLVKGDERSELLLLGMYAKKCQNDIERRLKELSKKAIGREISSHSLRAAKATDLDKQKVSISKIRDLLGHANLSTTSIYIRNKPEELEKELKEKDIF